MRYGIVVSLALLAVSCGGETAERAGKTDDGPVSEADFTEVDGASLGTVVVAGTCSGAAQMDLERGLALLHSMTYEEAARAFDAATEADPDCAMGYWGQAMTFVHPLWSDPPSEQAFERGRELLRSARDHAVTGQELAYIEALEAYYDAGRSGSEKPNLVAFEAGWRDFHDTYPEDPEGAAFYALAQLATVDPADKTYSKQRQAGALAEQVLASIPDHPGAHHYIIHAYDNPELSSGAVEVARSYGGVAPEVPHALHMPTHTFTRLGLWQESIDWNRRSADAALKHPVGDAKSLHYFHALDYLAYAYLQGAEDGRAATVLAELQAVEPPYQPHLASAYTFAAVPARLTLERHLWDAAADLEPRSPSDYPWDTAASSEAITYFARALGAARSGRFEQARSDLATLSGLQAKVAAASPYWGTQVEIQRLSALAWLQFEEGDREGGLETMQRAASMEAGTEKHPVTPGEVLPARELLADMYMEFGRFKEALAAYEAALDRSPNRFNSLYGAGMAATKTGELTKAAEHFDALLEVTSRADTNRPRLEEVRGLVGTHATESV
ncbi:MAG: tetratricopeptide repeat protein [Gemmatimonadetes bacterium]|nr:tetratricopeptide repeat protein [Gemmatimonadota bacterium]